MCTHIASVASIAGAGKAGGNWFPLKQLTVGYDHATQGVEEHALLIDFVNYDIGLGARVAVEIDLASGKALVERLQQVIARAESLGFGEMIGEEVEHDLGTHTSMHR